MRRRGDNAEAAKRSRKRKKEYLETIESQVAELKEENKKLKRQLRAHQQKGRLAFAGMKEDCFECVLEGISGLQDRLQTAASAHRPNSEEINHLIEQIDHKYSRSFYNLHRVGAEGVVRKQTVNHLFAKIIDTLVPSHLKYLVWSIDQESSPFVTGTAAKKKSANSSRKNKYDDLI